MRSVLSLQPQLGATDIGDIQLNPQSRDDIPAVLKGLQCVYCDPARRAELFALLERQVQPGTDRSIGRPGMDLWQVLVMGLLKQGINCDFDRLQELVNNHIQVRQMLGLGAAGFDSGRCALQTVLDNVALLSADLLDEFFDFLDHFEDDRNAYVLLLRGAGRSFCAGYDLASSRTVEPGSPGDILREQSVGRSRRTMIDSVDRYLRLFNTRKPTIAQVHGHCISGGTELISMFDFVVCTETAKFGHIAGRHMGTLRTLSLWPWTVGYRRAKELFMTGELIEGTTAEEWGLVNKAVPEEELEEATLHLARKIMRIPLEVNILHKHSVNRWMEIQGLQPAIHSAAEFDVYTAFIDGRPGFRERVEEDGLREALRWRDREWRGTELWDHGKDAEES